MCGASCSCNCCTCSSFEMSENCSVNSSMSLLAKQTESRPTSRYNKNRISRRFPSKSSQANLLKSDKEKKFDGHLHEFVWLEEAEQVEKFFEVVLQRSASQ